MRAGVRVGKARALAPQRRLLAGREAGGLHAACFTRKLSACPPWSPRPAFPGGGGVTKTCVLPPREAIPETTSHHHPIVIRSRVCLRIRSAHIISYPLSHSEAAAFARTSERRPWPSMRVRRRWRSRFALASARSNRAARPARGATPETSRGLPPPKPIAAGLTCQRDIHRGASSTMGRRRS
jgi:hypothetical protein